MKPRRTQAGYRLYSLRDFERLEHQDNMDWSKKYYRQEAQAKIEERKQLWSPENQERWSREWSDLFGDVEAALGDGKNSWKPLPNATRKSPPA